MLKPRLAKWRRPRRRWKRWRLQRQWSVERGYRACAVRPAAAGATAAVTVTVTVAVVALALTACASGAAVRLPPAALGPTAADAQLVVALRQPLIADLMGRLEGAAVLPADLDRAAQRLTEATALLVFGVLPQERGTVLAMVPQTRYPAQAIGWQLHLSDLVFHTGAGSGVRHFWSDPAAGFGVVVFPNLIFSFWLDPREFGAAGEESSPAVREMIRTALAGAGVDLHPAAAAASEAELFAYLRDVDSLVVELDPRRPAGGRRLPLEAAWAGSRFQGPSATIAGGIALQTDRVAPYLALVRLLLVNLLTQLDAVSVERLRAIRVAPGEGATITVTGLRLPRVLVTELLWQTVRSLRDGETLDSDAQAAPAGDPVWTGR